MKINVANIGELESLLQMELKKIDQKQFKIMGAISHLAEYKIREIGTGFSAIEFLISKIITEKFYSQKRVSINLDWKDYVVIPVQLSITPKNTSIQLSNQFNNVFDKKRMDEIMSYSSKINEEFPPPLFIHSSIIEKLTLKPSLLKRLINNKKYKLYKKPYALLLDGARRISAYSLKKTTTIKAEFILTRIMLKSWLLKTDLENIFEKFKELSWFKDYQNIPEIGQLGERSLKRYKYLDLKILKNKTIADFGCNTGQSCFEYYYNGAKQVFGFDVQKEVVDIANMISRTLGISDYVKFFRIDFNEKDCFKKMDTILTNKIDYTSFFSVYRTKELTQREKLFSYIIEKTKEKIFFEGHADNNIDTLDYYDNLFRINQLNGKFVGFSEENIRPLFIVSKNNTIVE